MGLAVTASPGSEACHSTESRDTAGFPNPRESRVTWNALASRSAYASDVHLLSEEFQKRT